MQLVWAIVGAFIGGLVAQGIPGAVAGFAIGLLWARTSQLGRNLDDAVRRLDELTAKAASAAREPGRDEGVDWQAIERARTLQSRQPEPVATPAAAPEGRLHAHWAAAAEPAPPG